MFDDDFQITSSLRKNVHLDVINLIDLLIILIIFLITTTTFAKLGIRINQPKSDNQSKAPPVSLQVDIDRTGTFYFEQKPITAENLKSLIQTKLRIKPNTVIIINADKNSQTQHLIDAIDISKKAGAEKFSFSTQRK